MCCHNGHVVTLQTPSECRTVDFKVLCQYYVVQEVPLMFYHWAVNKRETCYRSHWVTAGGALQPWSFGTSFTSCLPTWQQGWVCKSFLHQNVSAQDSVSTRPALTSPACCSCDLRAFCAPHGGRRLHREESVARWVGLCTAGQFCTSSIDAVDLFSMPVSIPIISTSYKTIKFQLQSL